MMQYKGYVGQVELDAEASLLHGEIVNIRDVVTFQGRSVEELQTAFRESVDDYLAFCAERGEEPDKPFSGKFVTRIDPVLHRQASSAAASAGKSLNAWLTEQIERAVATESSDRETVRVAAASKRRPDPKKPLRKKLA
jgi:predicted HicB family RNase H-like nuclease